MAGRAEPRRLPGALGIPGIEGIDTRALVRHLRDHGSQEAVLSRPTSTPSAWCGGQGRARHGGADLVSQVTCAEPYGWEQGPWKLGGYLTADEIAAALGRPPFKVVAYDYGIKCNILRRLVGSGCAVRVVPAQTPARDVLALRRTASSSPTVRAIRPPLPTRRRTSRSSSARCRCSASASAIRFSAWRWAARTSKLKFGHHGGNQPVKDLTTGKVEITAQNHGFVVDLDSLGDRAEGRT